MSNLNFGQAIEALKEGHKISRNGWDGKNMYLLLSKGKIACETVDLSEEDKKATMADMSSVVSEIDGVPVRLFEGVENLGAVDVLPHIYMITATQRVVNGWLASQTDMLAEDWGIAD